MKKNARIKRLIIDIHVWLGLVVGAIWALQGLTGALLVFHRELDAPRAASMAGQRLSLDSLIVAASRTGNGAAEAIGVYYPGEPILAVTIAGPAGQVSVLVDEVSGAIVGERARKPSSPSGGNLWRWIYNLHHGLLIGKTGEWVLGASGILLLSSALGGIWLGWPRRKHWRQAFAAGRWRSRLQRLFGCHRATGLAAGVGLGILGLSGAMIDFAEPLRAGAERAGIYRPAFKLRPGTLPNRPISAERALQVAAATFPAASFVSLQLPSVTAPAYRVRMRNPGEWRAWSGTSIVTVDAGSSAVLDAYDAARAPIANQVLESAFPVHSGELAGFLGRILVFAAGLSLPVLYLTGLWAWIAKRTLRTRRAYSPQNLSVRQERAGA